MKPTSLMIRDGEKKIIETINNTQLPPCIIKLILEKIKNQVDKLCYEEEQMDIKKYETEKKQKKEEKQKNTDSDRGGAWRRPCRCLVF